MSEDIIRDQFGNKETLNTYNFILIRGNQPTNMKKLGMYCVVYSILLFILNYNNLNEKIYKNKQNTLKIVFKL